MTVKIYLKSRNIKIILAKKNINLSDFASTIGVSRTTLSLWLGHKRSPNVESRKRIQNFLGKSRKWEELFLTDINTSTAEELE